MDFISRCLTYQQMKVEHKQLCGLLQPLLVLELNWEYIMMDFVVGLLKSHKGLDAVWVIVNRMTKSTPFLPIRMID